MSRTTAAPKRPVLSGFCNPSWRLDTAQGRGSHARCHLPGCSCRCHLHWVVPLPVAETACDLCGRPTPDKPGASVVFCPTCVDGFAT